jgi:hypothetical protein
MRKGFDSYYVRAARRRNCFEARSRPRCDELTQIYKQALKAQTLEEIEL